MISATPVHTLRDLTLGMPIPAVDDDIVVSGICLDSRQIQVGDLFVAVPGYHADGRRFIEQSIEAGAAAILSEAPSSVNARDVRVPVIEVDNLRRQIGTLADRFYGHPSEHLCVVGVTGTNGKTTCAHLLAQALEHLGVTCGLLGTLGNGRPNGLKPSPLTTADAIGVHRELKSLLNEGARAVCMEVSSHALDQGRIDKVAFDIAIFTNLSQDHLDYHDDMASYGAAKARLFRAHDLSACIVNVDDAFGRHLAEEINPELLWSYGDSEDARIRRQSLDFDNTGIRMDVSWDEHRAHLKVPLRGRFNADNALAVFAALLALGIKPVAAADAMASLQSVPGRMETFESTGFPCVVVDYAHTPDALEKALIACRDTRAGKIWVVFGCGGDRDREKRPAMGAIAARLADYVVLTNDNPRSESPESIIHEIQAGGDGREVVLMDRRKAIAHAIAGAKDKDIVLVAGKGHETGQIVGNEIKPFNDRECVLKLLGGAR